MCNYVDKKKYRHGGTHTQINRAKNGALSTKAFVQPTRDRARIEHEQGRPTDQLNRQTLKFKQMFIVFVPSLLSRK